jgi:hypothetical protein
MTGGEHVLEEVQGKRLVEQGCPSQIAAFRF